MIGLRPSHFFSIALLAASTLAEYEVLTDQKKMKRVAKVELGKYGCCLASSPDSCPGFDSFCLGDIKGCDEGTMTWVTPEDSKKFSVVQTGSCGRQDAIVNIRYAYSCFTCPTGYKQYNTYNNTCAGSADPPTCHGCNTKGETLVQNVTTGQWGCVANCKLNAAAETWLKELEGWNANFYYDTSKPPKRTIGWGHNCDAHKDCDKITEPVDATSAGKLFAADTAEAIGTMRTLPNVDLLNYNQFVVLASWAYNYGNVLKFTDLMAGGDIAGVLAYMQKAYDSTTDAGLKNRRAKEIAKFKEETATKSGCTTKK